MFTSKTLLPSESIYTYGKSLERTVWLGKHRILRLPTEWISNNLVSTFFGAQLGNSSSRVWVTGKGRNKRNENTYFIVKFFAVWKSLQHHHAFMQEESYADLGLSLMEAMSGPNIINQALITASFSSLERALSAPVTQFVYITSRPLHDRGYELVPLIEKLQTMLKKIPSCVASCWGPSTEKEKLQVGIVGWTSLEVRIFVFSDSYKKLKFALRTSRKPSTGHCPISSEASEN